MSMGFGDEVPVEPLTAHGRTWPCLRQFGVFMENRVGCLHDLLRQVERHDLRVAALSIVDSVDHAVARLVVNNYERALELLEFANAHMFETDVIGVELPDNDQPHLSICSALMSAELNIHYTYPLMYRKNGRGAVVLYVEDIDEGLRVLNAAGHKVITESDLIADDEFYG
jgi:hypothetical protein